MRGQNLIILLWCRLSQLCLASIILNFDVNGDEANNKIFYFRDVTTTNVTDEGASRPVFSVSNSSRGLLGARGSLRLQLTGKEDTFTAENASSWSFGQDTIIHSNVGGVGVQSEGERGARAQYSRGKALLLSFNTSALELKPGTSLVFRILCGEGEAYRIYQRTGERLATEIFSESQVRGAIYSNPIAVTSGYSTPSMCYEFALLDAGVEGGNLRRVKSLEVDVVHEDAAKTTPPTSEPFSAASSYTEVALDFKSAGSDAARKIFKFAGIGSPYFNVSDVGAPVPVFTLSSTGADLVGATGSLEVSWTGKDGNITGSTSWSFGQDAIIQSSTSGLSIRVLGVVGGALQLETQEAFILSFDTSKLTMDASSTLVFTILGGPRASYRIMKRAGLRTGIEVFKSEGSIHSIPSDAIPVKQGYQSRPGMYDFAIADIGTNGDSKLRITRFAVGILNSRTTAPRMPLKFFSFFTDNMILQRNDIVNIYGSATPGVPITVNFGTLQNKSTTADNNGNWIVQLDPMPASNTPQALTVTDGFASSVVSNILVGDIWLCSGQSNMDRPFWSYRSFDTNGKDNKFIRLVQIQRLGVDEPSEKVYITKALDFSWQECSSKYLTDFSPAAYFFAAKMQEQTNVPIGLIHAAVGGTYIEQWLPPDATDSSSDEQMGELYNGMIHPLRNFTFQGMLWYQGESNARWPLAYRKRFPALIGSWRRAFSREEMPFYFAQLASHGERTWDVTDTAKAFLREAQQMALSLVNTRMVVLTDVGEYLNLHPENKQAVGERFAQHALQAAGVGGINTNSPRYKKMRILGGKVVITFDNVGEGLETRQVVMNYHEHLAQGQDRDAFVAPAQELLGFALAGPNEIFVEANATITAYNEVTVWSEYVPNPIACRYCFKWFGLCNLYASNGGWVATPFRTDDFMIPDFSGLTFGEHFDKNHESLGFPLRIDTLAGSSSITPVKVGGVDGFKIALKGNSTRVAFYSNSDPSFGASLKPYVFLKILYYDQGLASNEIQFQYANSESVPVLGPVLIEIQNTMTWRVATAVLRDIAFGKKLYSHDIRLFSKTDIVIGGVYLSNPSQSNSTSDAPSPPNVETSGPTPPPTIRPSLRPTSSTEKPSSGPSNDKKSVRTSRPSKMPTTMPSIRSPSVTIPEVSHEPSNVRKPIRTSSPTNAPTTGPSMLRRISREPSKPSREPTREQWPVKTSRPTPSPTSESTAVHVSSADTMSPSRSPIRHQIPVKTSLPTLSITEEPAALLPTSTDTPQGSHERNHTRRPVRASKTTPSPSVQPSRVHLPARPTHQADLLVERTLLEP